LFPSWSPPSWAFSFSFLVEIMYGITICF
jgi:hypothetical protein